jgi:formylglycine-generating enzyme required for sulfatase activity
MPTPQELLQKLEERFILGEISEETYKQLKANLLARIRSLPTGAGGLSIGDGTVAKLGDVEINERKTDVGGIVINVPTAQPAAPVPPGLVECPLCGRQNTLKGTFRCRQCARPHLCVEHFVRKARMCEECVEKDAEARRRVEEDRKRRQAALKAAQAPPPPPKPAFRVCNRWPFDAAEAQRRQQQTAAALGAPDVKDFDLGGGVKLRMVLIPAGEFGMGSPPSEGGRSDDETPRRVRIEAPFYMGKYPVTQEQWQAVMGNNPSRFKGAKNPVETVTWHDCVAAAEELATRFPRAGFALPTEAQWEYACRAGCKARFCFGASEGRLGNHAWYDGNSRSKTHPVGEKRPNAWGLHDVHGNVWEWTASPYSSEYDGSEMMGADEGGGGRALRGGSWGNGPRDLRSAYRRRYDPAISPLNLGVRLVCRPQE